MLEVDGNMIVDGLPVLSPTFEIEGESVVFSGGDLRNTILDFRETDVEALVLAEIRSELGSFGTGSEKNYTLGVLLDDEDQRLFLDEDWIYFPGAVREIDAKGPYATVHTRVQRRGEGVDGAVIKLDGIERTTQEGGWATIALTGVESQILTIRMKPPGGKEFYESTIALPIACARPGLAHYKTITFDLP